jgi:hypothetical protein
MVRKRVLERWETKLSNCEVTPQAIMPVAKSLTKRGGPMARSTMHGPLDPIFYPINKSNVIADCLENRSELMTCVTVTTDDMWRLKSKTCRLLWMNTPLLLSDPVTSQKKYNPSN